MHFAASTSGLDSGTGSPVPPVENLNTMRAKYVALALEKKRVEKEMDDLLHRISQVI